MSGYTASTAGDPSAASTVSHYDAIPTSGNFGTASTGEVGDECVLAVSRAMAELRLRSKALRYIRIELRVKLVKHMMEGLVYRFDEHKKEMGETGSSQVNKHITLLVY